MKSQSGQTLLPNPDRMGKYLPETRPSPKFSFVSGPSLDIGRFWIVPNMPKIAIQISSIHKHRKFVKLN